jgi:hypothetical protein
MRFLFDCEDDICLPMAYKLVDEFKPFIDKVKDIDVDEETIKDRKVAFKKILENIMVKYPKETGELLSKLWVLDEGEKAPNTFKTLAIFFSNEVATDFFTSVLPSLFTLSKSISPLLK